MASAEEMGSTANFDKSHREPNEVSFLPASVLVGSYRVVLVAFRSVFRIECKWNWVRFLSTMLHPFQNRGSRSSDVGRSFREWDVGP